MNESQPNPPRTSPPVPVYPDPLMEDEIDLLDYVEVIVRRRWLIVWAVLVCAVAAVVYAKQQPQVFVAEATILPADEQDFLNLGEGMQRGRQRSFYIDILKSLPINRSVLQKVYAYELDGIAHRTDLMAYFDAKTVQRGIDALLGVAEFKSGQTGVITISVETRSGDLSAAVANMYVEQLIFYNRDKRQMRIKEQLAFIENRLAEIQKELAQAEEALVEFRTQHRELEEEAGYLAPEPATEYSRLQREVQIRSSLLSTVLNQYEIARVEAQKEVPNVEALNYAEAPEFGSRVGAKKAVVLASAVGLFASVFLAFLLEYIQRNRQSGRLEPFLEELRGDVDRAKRFLGKKERER